MKLLEAEASEEVTEVTEEAVVPETETDSVEEAPVEVSFAFI